MAMPLYDPGSGDMPMFGFGDGGSYGDSTAVSLEPCKWRHLKPANGQNLITQAQS